jgi:acetyl-CoA C-acetyltransferase
MTVNQACASGLTTVFTAIEKIRATSARSIYAGGVESMSNTPYFLMGARFGYRLGNQEVVDGMRKDGFFCPMSQMLMGETVETYLAQELGISRTEQDAYALSSQQRADAAWKAARFSREIAPFEGLLTEDEHRRADTTLESLAKLSPVFDPKVGTITAGNSSGITDGAAFLHVSADRHAHSSLEVVDYETVAIDPRRMGVAPVPAIRNLLARQKLEIGALEAVEINEAFAAQIVACQRELKIAPERLNAWGGSIALGHPIGASGARILVTLDSRLHGKPGALGIAALCVSGGMGVALLVRAL